MLSLDTQTASNFEDLTNMQFGWEFSVAQLGPNIAESSVALYRSPRVGYSRFQFNCNYDQRLHARAGFVTFGLLEPDCPQVALYEQVIPSNSLIVFPDEEDLKAATLVGFRASGMHFEESFLDFIAQTVHRQPLAKLLPSAGLFSLAPAKLRAIHGEFQKWRQMAEVNASNQASFVARREMSLAMAVLDGIVSAQRIEQPSLLKSEKALNLALEFIHDGELPDISAVDLCQYTNSSQRSLEKAFIKRFDVTPKKYIKYLRMSRVRHELLSLGSQDCATIIEIAGVHGFWHMGQFAADYRRIYGELPSETTRRA